MKILTADGKEKGKCELPVQFSEEIRPDLVKKAVLAIQNNRRQPYGASPEAGKRHSAYLSKRRRAFRGTYGIGQSRTPRKAMSHRGTRFNFVGAVAPQTRGGRRAHPPKADKEWGWNINKKERRKAIRSAMSATIVKDIVSQRHKVMPETYPFVADSSVEKLKTTKEARSLLVALGFEQELERTKQKKVRAGRGKTRGRKYKRKVGPLFVVSGPCDFAKAARNIPGVDVVSVRKLNAELLAPGCSLGRMTVFTQEAVSLIEKERLFM